MNVDKILSRASLDSLGCILYAPLNNDCYDYSANALSNTDSGISYSKNTNGHYYGVFDGSHSIAVDSILDRPTSYISLGMWLNFNDLTSARQGMFSYYNSQMYYGYDFVLYGDTDQLGFRTFSSNGAPLSDITVSPFDLGISTGTWYHIGITKDDTNMYMYLNGQLIATETDGVDIVYTTTMYPLIGQNTIRSSYTRYFNGGIAEVMAFDTAISQKQWQQIYNATYIE